MKYLLKEDKASIILMKYKNNYIANKLGLSLGYVSNILHRKKSVSKRTAYSLAKILNTNYEISDLFDVVKK